MFTFIGGYASDRLASRVPTLLCFLGALSLGFVTLSMADSLSSLALACLPIGTGEGDERPADGAAD